MDIERSNHLESYISDENVKKLLNVFVDTEDMISERSGKIKFTCIGGQTNLKRTLCIEIKHFGNIGHKMVG
jgi:hypothetical protein